ncbi:acyl-CoA dehydrogenase [Streptomyces albus]|uniref:Acyl-CoA dehydrogenase n=1 Tax=Streptomyces albus (strain ATCC 21838 / DSM 41398 / FERM P-419 / JCM 4703 / NBRC 107858) TaxID=1081613 RepID=A0A0B5EWU6_STRA4|nr:acyl-CoA dehydrogenase [Streptomyces albus]AOU81576.1 acyl-CoA dehydrogenase [Streptomyces albus]AYN37269.1 acyl-CoA dehydrogenase [Streptomyces albus]
MVSFAFSSEQEDFRRELIRFARAELAPRYTQRAARAEFPWDAHQQLAELGVLGIGLPEEYGGTGVPDPVSLGIATEALAYGDCNVAAAPVQVGLVAAQLAHEGSKEVAGEYVPRLIAGEIVAAIAVTEPSAGSDASHLRCEARPVEDGWRLSGEKIAITHATTAAIGLVYARHPGSSGYRGISCFLVPLDAKGVTRGAMPGMGALPLGWGTLSFDEVFIPADHLVGEEGNAFSGVMHHFDFSRPALGLLCLGAAQASVDEAVAWAQQREAFGRPIAAFQGVSFPLAEHATYLEAARWLCYRALWMRETGQPHTDLAAMCKWWPPQIAKDAIETSWVTHGNLGYSTELPLQQRYRDVASYLVADGSAAIQKRIIATRMFGKVAAQ